MTTSAIRSSPAQGFTLVEITIVVTFIAVLAAIAIPAFARVIDRSREAAVVNNARQISAALDTFYVDNGTTTARWADIVGSSKYIKEFQAVAGESYPATYTQGEPFTITGIGGHGSLTINP